MSVPAGEQRGNRGERRGVPRTFVGFILFRMVVFPLLSKPTVRTDTFVLDFMLPMVASVRAADLYLRRPSA